MLFAKPCGDSRDRGQPGRGGAACGHVNLATALGFDETRCGQVAIVAPEVASNLFKHARDGVLLLQPLEQGKAIGIEILALDRGPGMTDVSRCRRDGFSTAASPGNGLGAIARLSTLLDIYSLPQVGTVLLARLWSGSQPHCRPGWGYNMPP